MKDQARKAKILALAESGIEGEAHRVFDSGMSKKKTDTKR